MADSAGRFALAAPVGPVTLTLVSRYYDRVQSHVVVPTGDTVHVRLATALRAFFRAPRVLEPENLSWLDNYGTAREIETAVAALGGAPLQRRALPEGTRERRVWANYGLFVPLSFTRLVQDPSGVRGELVTYWPLDPYNPSLDARVRELEEAARCDTFATEHHDYTPPEPLGPGERACQSENDTSCRPLPSPGVAACRVRLEEEPDWAALLTRLEAHGVWTLPDESVFPFDGTMSTDGWSLIVFARDGAAFRAYSYGNSDRHHPVWPEPVRAHAIARTLRDAVRAGAPWYD